MVPRMPGLPGLGLTGVVPQKGSLDRLADAIPEGEIEHFALGHQGRFNLDGWETGNYWLRSAIDAADATDAYSGTFNRDTTARTGPGGVWVLAVELPDEQSANRSLELAYTAFVCKFGADPFSG